MLVDALGGNITALSEDVVKPDTIKIFSVALHHAHVISGAQMNELLIEYLSSISVMEP